MRKREFCARCLDKHLEVFICQKRKSKWKKCHNYISEYCRKIENFCVFAGWDSFFYEQSREIDSIHLIKWTDSLSYFISSTFAYLFVPKIFDLFSFSAAISLALIFPFGSNAGNNKIFACRLEKRDNSSRGEIGGVFMHMHAPEIPWCTCTKDSPWRPWLHFLTTSRSRARIWGTIVRRPQNVLPAVTAFTWNML